MKTITCKKAELDKRLLELSQDIEEPLYRGIWTGDYKTTGILKPNPGSLSAGTGVFFTNSLEYAKTFMDRTLVITSKKLLDPNSTSIDTREPGYDKEAQHALDKKYGKGKYDGYTLWDEITSHDTITNEGGREGTYVYSRRTQVTQDELIAEIRIEDEACA